MEENNNVEVLEEKNEVKEIKSEAAPIQPKKKGNGGLIVVIVLLLAVCIGLGGFVFINKDKLFSTNEPKKEEKKETKKEEKEPVVTTYAVTDEKVAKLIDNLLKFGQPTCEEIELLANDKKVEAKDISNDTAWIIALSDSSVSGDSISLDTINKAIQKYLGKDYTFDPKAANTNICGSNYEYDESTKTFNKKTVSGGCGGTCAPATSSYRMTKAVDTDGILKIDVKVIYGCNGHENCDGYTYYSDYARTNVIGNYNQDKVEDLYNKGADYQFTFKLEDGNYVFVSSEPVK